MKKTIALAALLVGGLGLQAAESKGYSVTVDFPFVTKYVFRGIELNKEAFQPSIEIASGGGYAGLWTNFGIKEEDDYSDTNELDFYAGYNFTLSDTSSLDVGLTYYYYPEANTSFAPEYTYEAYVGLNFDLGGVTPALYAYYDFELEAFTFQGSVGYSIPMTDLGTSLDLSATLGTVEPDEGDGFLYWGLGATVPFQLSDNTKLNVGLSYASNDLDGVDDNHLWFSIGVTTGF